MWKSLVTTFIIILSLSLSACSIGVSNLKNYADNFDGYRFLYPNGWIAADVQGASVGVDAVFRDLIERNQTLSVIISDVPEEQTLEKLGTPTEVGYRFLKETKANPNLQQTTKFIDAHAREDKGKTYYILEYVVNSANGLKRHNLASVNISRDQLFTFNISCPQSKWQKLAKTFQASADSFSVY